MVRKHTATSVCSRDRSARRATVLRVGALLGWRPQEIAAFAEALTGRGWRHCGPAEFQLVLDEYLALGQVIQDRTARRTRTSQKLVGTGGADATSA